MIHQGPFRDKPDGVPDPVPEHIWGRSHLAGRYRGWGQVRDGSWYAFYANVGPSPRDIPGHAPLHPSWHEEHETDPNWWSNPSNSSNSSEPKWACRHGARAGDCPDGSCGEEPGVFPTEAEVISARLRAISLLKSLEPQMVESSPADSSPQDQNTER